MTNEEGRRLQTLLQEVPVGPPPIDEIIEAGKNARRAKRLKSAALMYALVLIITGGVIFNWNSADKDDGESAASDTGPTDSSPVVTRVTDYDVPYPTAVVSGKITLREGCLLLNKILVFWPAGTTWDSQRQTVQFHDDFAGAPDVTVGTTFTGGGGTWEIGSALDNIIEGKSRETLRECAKRTGATKAQLAYPTPPG